MEVGKSSGGGSGRSQRNFEGRNRFRMRFGIWAYGLPEALDEVYGTNLDDCE